jgi:hypothetical protein
MWFEPNQPVETLRPTAVVDAGLPRGRHRFRLVVVNARGQKSRPSEVIVTVVGRKPPARPGPMPNRGPIREPATPPPVPP